MAWSRTPFASAAGCIVATALSTTSGSSTGCTSRRILPETIRETSSTSSTICVSDGGVALEGFEAARRLLAGQHPAAQQPRVADDRVERRAQLVREHREELVLHAGWRSRASSYSRAFSSATDGPRGDAQRQPLVLLGEDADLRVSEEQPAEHLAATRP